MSSLDYDANITNITRKNSDGHQEEEDLNKNDIS